MTFWFWKVQVILLIQLEKKRLKHDYKSKNVFQFLLKEENKFCKHFYLTCCRILNEKLLAGWNWKIVVVHNAQWIVIFNQFHQRSVY